MMYQMYIIAGNRKKNRNTGIMKAKISLTKIKVIFTLNVVNMTFLFLIK